MNEKYVLVEHLSAINKVIHNTFQTTQRIKLTAFDVSPKYLIFGVNSGGIYIFSRETCQFLKLIPSTHGPANLLLISKDETNLAIAISTGLVIILEDCFDNANFQQQIFCEHEGNVVTAMKWNGNDLYCGDSSGRVSVTTIKSFLTKAMFQAPVACLMHLDSQIVQLDTHYNFLLVSTLTRTLLCDTETERYRQIGKKGRDGQFGACFFNTVDSIQASEITQHVRGTFQTVADNETLSSSKMDGSVKIYCARPGARLWQADFEADVIFTHQFRPSLSQKQSNIIQWGDNPDEALEIRKFPDGVEDIRVESFNFGKIFTILNKFIVTFKDEGLFVFEPSSSALIFRRRLSNIKDVKIIDSSLFIWYKDLEISIMSVLTVEELILKSLLKKQYLFCGQLCVEYLAEVQSLIDNKKSKKIHLVSVLENRLSNNCDLLEKLGPILQRLKDSAKTPSLEKYKNGIVSVNNHYPVKIPESVENYQTLKPSRKDPYNILLEQYRINKNHNNIQTTQFTELLKSLDLEETYKLFTNFSKRFLQEPEEESCEIWCKTMFLKNMNGEDNFGPSQLKYATEAFLQLNNREDLACKCNFPLPKAHKTIPKFYDIGCILMEKSDNIEIFLRAVPYMQRYFLEKIEDLKDIQLKLHLLIQYSDSELIKNLLNKMIYDLWEDSIHLLIKLKNNQCLHCGSKIDGSGAISWKHFGLLMVQSIKAPNALKIFKRYAHLLPKGELDEFFFQYCIFSTVSNLNGKNNLIMEILADDKVDKQFENSVEAYLRKRYVQRVEYEPLVGNKSSDLNCDHCQLPLKTPLIETTNKLNCGHYYHQVCLLYNESRCIICNQAY